MAPGTHCWAKLRDAGSLVSQPQLMKWKLYPGMVLLRIWDPDHLCPAQQQEFHAKLDKDTWDCWPMPSSKCSATKCRGVTLREGHPCPFPQYQNHGSEIQPKWEAGLKAENSKSLLKGSDLICKSMEGFKPKDKCSKNDEAGRKSN